MYNNRVPSVLLESNNQIKKNSLQDVTQPNENEYVGVHHSLFLLKKYVEKRK